MQNENEIKRKDKQVIGPYKRVKKKLWDMRVAVIPIVVGMVLEKRLEELEIRERIKALENTELLRSAKILRRDQDTWGELLSPQI